MGPKPRAGARNGPPSSSACDAARPAWRAVAAAWRGRDQDTLALTAAALGALVAATLVTFAIFQILAAVLGP